MDGYQKIIQRIILGSVCFLFSACGVERPLGVHLYQPHQTDSGSKVLIAGTHQADSGSAVLIAGINNADSGKTPVFSDTVKAYQTSNPGMLLALEDSTLAAIQMPAGKPVMVDENIPSVDSIIHPKPVQAEDSLRSEVIVSTIAISVPHDDEIATSCDRDIIAGQDSIIRLLEGLVRSTDSLQQAATRSVSASLGWIEKMNNHGTAHAIDSMFFTAGLDSTGEANTNDLMAKTTPDRLPPAPESPQLSGATAEVLVMPANEVNATIRSLAEGLTNSLLTIQQQVQVNKDLLEKLETELKGITPTLNVPSSLYVVERSTPESNNKIEESSGDVDYLSNMMDTVEIAGNLKAGHEQLQEPFDDLTGNITEPSPGMDSISGAESVVSLQLKHYREIMVLQDSIRMLESENAALAKKAQQLQPAPGSVPGEITAPSIDTQEADVLIKDYERILGEKADSIKMLKETVPPVGNDNTGQAHKYAFVVYFESSSLTGRNIEEFERVIDSLPLQEVTSVYLSAFTDQSGTEEANHYISEQRLRLLTDLLTDRGIDPLKIYKQNNGEQFASRGAAKMDRRVEITFTF